MPLSTRTDPDRLSDYFRNEDRDPDLARRRWAVGLSLAGVAAGQVVSLYQTGIVGHLPDPPVGPFDADKVDASSYAYKRGDTPDGLMMTASYGVTALLAGAGGEDRADRAPWLPIAAFAKAAYDVALAGKLAQEEWRTNRALCAYCQGATLASVATAAVLLPEALRAAGNLLGQR